MNIQKLGTAVASGAMLLASISPLASAATVQETGNGAFSNNTVTLTQTSNTTVSQGNTMNVANNVTTNANSGGNSTFGTTGGTVTIATGNTAAAAQVTNTGNTNVANVNPCGGCAGQNTTVILDGNGAVSDNTATVVATNNTTVGQTNAATIRNDVRTNANSGGNDASFTTGGNVSIRTGSASTDTRVVNDVNRNAANVGGSAGTGTSGGATIRIVGNGAFSDNTATLIGTNNTTLTQGNTANFRNDITSNANSGDNSIFAATGGNSEILTGPASSRVEVLNRANFNVANLASCCVGTGPDIKIGGNGFDSTNTTVALLTSNGTLGQGNSFTCGGQGGKCANVDANANSGLNANDFSTGPTGTDPLIITGGSASYTGVANEGNVNAFGTSTLPTFSPAPTGASSWSAWWLWQMSLLGM